MGFKKFGEGQITETEKDKVPEHVKKIAQHHKNGWSPQDSEELAEENKKADQ